MTNHSNRVELPPSYYFAARETITPEEVMAVRQSVRLPPTSPKEWQRSLRGALGIVGVRYQTGDLVGFGDLYKEPHPDYSNAGSLGFVAVRPEHQGNGVGLAILKERIRIADAAGITPLEATVKTSSVMRHIYPTLGFTLITGGKNYEEYERHKA